MNTLISNSLIRSITPSAKPYEVRDERVKGFLLRIQPSGAMSYYVEYRRGKRKRIGPEAAYKPDEARKEARRILHAHHKGEDLRASELTKSVRSLSDFLDKVYEPWVVAHLSTGTTTCARIRFSFSTFLSLPLPEITAHEVEKWRSKRLSGGAKPTTVNRDLGDLKAAMTRAMTWGYVDDNPLRAVRPSKVDRNVKSRFLSDDELSRLRKALDARESRLRDDRQSGNAWRKTRGYSLYPNIEEAAFGDYLKPMALVSINTGLRRGELFSLTWKDVDFSRAILTVSGGNAKSGRTRHLPLNSEALDILQGWKLQSNETDGLIFRNKEGERFDNVRRSWAGVLNEAKIEAFRWHDLRHTFASRLVMAGVDLNTVRELLGHSDYKMTLRYAHLAPAHKAAAVEKLIT
jgi:integrase